MTLVSPTRSGDGLFGCYAGLLYQMVLAILKQTVAAMLKHIYAELYRP